MPEMKTSFNIRTKLWSLIANIHWLKLIKDCVQSCPIIVMSFYSDLIQAGQWAVGVAGETAASLHFYPCPPGYCRCFNESLVGDNLCTNKYFNSDPDMQCTQGRRGIIIISAI